MVQTNGDDMDRLIRDATSNAAATMAEALHKLAVGLPVGATIVIERRADAFELRLLHGPPAEGQTDRVVVKSSAGPLRMHVFAGLWRLAADAVSNCHAQQFEGKDRKRR